MCDMVAVKNVKKDPPVIGGGPPTLEELQKQLSNTKRMLQQIKNKRKEAKVKRNTKQQKKSELAMIDAEELAVLEEKQSLLRDIANMQSGDTGGGGGGDSAGGSGGGGGGDSNGRTYSPEEIAHAYVTSELDIKEGGDDYKELYSIVLGMFQESYKFREAYNTPKAICGDGDIPALEDPTANNAIFGDYYDYINAKQTGEISRKDLEDYINEQVEHFVKPDQQQKFQKFSDDYKAYSENRDAKMEPGGSANPLEKDRQELEKAGKPAIGATAQQQLASQIQQDLVGLLPEGVSLQEGQEAVQKGGKTFTKDQTDPNSVPTGVAAATNPFVGKASTSGSYGQLNYGQVSGAPDVRKEVDPEGRTRFLFSDKTEGREGQTFTYPTIRPEYIIPGENDMAMSAYEQLRGDIEFDLFSVVKEGHGLGATNTLYLDNKKNEWGVRFKPKLYEPRAWIGPEHGVVPSRKEVQAVMTPETIQEGPKRARRLLSDQINYVRTLPGGASSGFLPDDNNRQKSSTGLGTNKPSPLLAHIDTHYYWQRQYDPAGVHMQNRKFRKLYDPLRQPQKNSVSQSGLVQHNQRTRRHPISYDLY